MKRAHKLIQPIVGSVAIDENTKVSASPDTVGLAGNLPAKEVLRLATEMGFNHIVQKNGVSYDAELAAAENLILAPENFRFYPVSSIFKPNDPSHVTERTLIACEQVFSSSVQKRSMLDAILNVLKSKGLTQTLVEDIIAVADELFTNAVFNAPFVDQKTFKNPGISRNSLEIRLAPGKQGRLFLAFDDDRVLIGCEDPYGSLSLDKYLEKIKATYNHGTASTMNFGPGGAGIGSFIIFNAASSLFAGVWPGEVTILCCVLPIGISNRKRAELPKNLHLIMP